MAVSSNDMLLSQQIEEFGHKLAEFPVELDVLLSVLDMVDVLLSQVEQSPSRQLLDSCSIAMKALVKEPLLKHSDRIVKVFVSSCLCEVFRITAPELPYEDSEMKETFQVIVSSFKEFSDMSSRSYSKQISILDNVSRVRSPVVMLDLECDSLIVEMFHNFLGSIRDYHPESVFTYMESIMTLVIEESEDVTLELLTPILGVLKKDKENIQTISRKLGEKVLERCTIKVKPYLLQAVKSLGGPLSQYSAIVACICEEAGVVEHHDDNESINQLGKAEESLDEPAPVIHPNEPNALLNVDVTKDSKAKVESPKLNDDQDNDKDAMVDKNSHVNTLASLEIEKDLALVSPPKHFENEVVDSAFEINNDKSLSTKENPIIGKPFSDPDGVEVGDECSDLQVTRQMNRKKVNSESSQEDKCGKEKMLGENTPPVNGTSSDVVEAKVSFDVVPGRISDSERRAQKSKIMSSNTQDACCDLGSLKDADRAFNLSVKRQKRSERKQMNMAQEEEKQDTVAKNDVEIPKGSNKINTHIPVDTKSDGTTSGDSETKPLIKEIEKRLSGKKRKGQTLKKPEAENVKNEKEKGAIHHSAKKQKVSDSKKAQQANQSVEKSQSETNASDPDEKLIKYFKKGKKGNTEGTSKGKENTDVKEDKASLKRKRKAESVPDAEILKQPAKRRQKVDDKDNCTDIISSPKSELASKLVKDGKHLEDSKVKSNRKQTTGKTKSDIAHGENLVDSKIKVWWKADHEFYEGIIVSFDLENKKHKVLYDDGEIEILNLKNETWEFVNDGTMKNKQEDKESNEGVSAKASRSKAVKSKKGGGKSSPDNDKSIMTKSNLKSNRGKSASKSKSKTPQVGSKSDGKGKKRS